MDRSKRIRSRAPLRLGLAGGGTDVAPYSEIYGGSVLNATINLYTFASIAPASSDEVVFRSIDKGIEQRYTLTNMLPQESCCPLPLHIGVYNAVMRRFNDCKGIPLTLTTSSDAPAGSGLGASSALVVAMVGAFVEYLMLPLGKYEIAHFAYEIERIELGMAGGKQDQYAAVFGGFNFMEFYKEDKIIVNPLRIPRDLQNELQYNLLLFYTGTSRISSMIIAEQVQNVSNKTVGSIEAMHRIKEQAIMMKEAILTNRTDDIGRILNFGWENKKKMANQISNSTIDAIYETAMKNGALGGKISGAGGGGFMMLYCDGDRKRELKQSLLPFEGTFIDFDFNDVGLETWEKRNG